MLQGVVSGGTGEEAAVPGYLVAGKTGTAAKPDASGGYSDTRYVASFVGIVPASAPRLVVLVSINEPQGQIFGGAATLRGSRSSTSTSRQTTSRRSRTRTPARRRRASRGLAL